MHILQNLYFEKVSADISLLLLYFVENIRSVFLQLGRLKGGYNELHIIERISSVCLFYCNSKPN